MFCKAQERLKRYLIKLIWMKTWRHWPWKSYLSQFLALSTQVNRGKSLDQILFWQKNYVQKMSQILLGGGLEEHCWDNVLVALVLLNFRPPTVAPSWTQYHAAPHSTPECPTVPPPARILFPKRGFLFPYLTEENKLIIITIYLIISCLHCFFADFSSSPCLAHCCTIFLKSSGYRNMMIDIEIQISISERSSGWTTN